MFYRVVALYTVVAYDDSLSKTHPSGAPWRVGDAVAGRKNAGWTASKTGRRCQRQNCSRWPPAKKTKNLCFSGSAPQCLRELIPRYDQPPRSLRLSSQSRLRFPSVDENHTKQRLDFKAFSKAAPILWNALPQALRESKTHLFLNQ